MRRALTLSALILSATRGDTINMTVGVAKDGSHNAAAQFIFVPTAFENHRVGVCKAVSR